MNLWENRQKVYFYEHLIWENSLAGALAAMISTLTFHPLDFIKVRLQVDEGKDNPIVRPSYRGISHAFKTVYRQAGLAAFYKGLTPNILSGGVSNAMYFSLYEAFKATAEQNLHSPDCKKVLSARDLVMASYLSGFVTTIVVNPICVIKTRMVLNYETEIGPLSMREVFAKIHKERGFYRGLTPSLLQICSNSAQMLLYEKFIEILTQSSADEEEQISAIGLLGSAALSKLIPSIITYPCQVIRTRQQDQHRPITNVFAVINDTWKYEGARGFFKGLWPNLLYLLPFTCVKFYLYERLAYYFLKKS